MLNKKCLVGLALAGIGALSISAANAAERRIGLKEVDLSRNTDTIDVSKANGSYTGVRLVADKDISISKVTVVYAGAPAHEEVRLIDLNAKGRRSRLINSGSNERFIDRVVLTYQPTSSARQARVEVLGVQSDAGARNKRAEGVVAAPKPMTPTVPTTGVGPAAIPSPGQVIRPGSGIVYAGKGQVLFAENTVGLHVDRDVIKVGADIGKFDKIRLRVQENDIDLSSLKVVYADGEPDTLTIGRRVAKGTTVGPYSLKGDRFIKEIQLVYKAIPKPTVGAGREAIVQVLGEYAEGWLEESRKFNQGWYLLGSESAGVMGFKKDFLEVGRNKGGFTKLRFTVKNRDITLKEIKVNFSNKNTEVVPVDSKVAAGTTTTPFTLKGGYGIESIQLVYRGRIFSREQGRAIVEVWGHD